MTAIRPKRAPSCVIFLPVWLLLVWLAACSNASPPKITAESKPLDEAIPAGRTRLRGAGATFPAVLYQRWFSVYHDHNPGTYVTYDTAGSTEGIRRFLGKGISDDEQVDFGASDAAMSDSQVAEANNAVLMLPATAGCVVLAYNVPGFNGELRLSRKAYAGVFLGEITSWDDPQIVQSNPGANLPRLTIATVVRQDGSGTTFAFTQNLDAISEKWRSEFGPATLVNWPGNAMRAKGNEGVAGLIQKSAGSIGYVGYEFARRLGLPFASLENRDGNYVRPSEQSCAKALTTAEMPENLRVFIPDPAGAESYPIVTFSWVLLRRSYGNVQTADAIVKLFEWSLGEGQRYASELGYVALPPEVAKKALLALSNVGPRS